MPTYISSFRRGRAMSSWRRSWEKKHHLLLWQMYVHSNSFLKLSREKHVVKAHLDQSLVSVLQVRCTCWTHWAYQSQMWLRYEKIFWNKCRNSKWWINICSFNVTSWEQSCVETGESFQSFPAEALVNKLANELPEDVDPTQKEVMSVPMEQ